MVSDESDSCILGVWRKKEHANGPRQLLQRAEACQDKLAQFPLSAAEHGFGDAMVFHVVPNLLVGVQFRGVGRQKEQPQLAAKAGYVVLHRTTVVIAAAVQDQEDRSGRTVHQPLQELRKDQTVDSAFRQHEAQVTASTHRRNHVHRTALPRTAHHWRLPLDAPGRARMAVRPHSRFIAKVDFRPALPRLLANYWIVLLLPLPHSLGVLLHRPEQRTLTRQPQLFEQPSHTGHAQLQLKLFPQQQPDHLAGPQRKLEAELQGTLADHCLIQPPHLRRSDLQGAPLQRTGFQRTPASGSVSGQPGVNATPSKAQRLDHNFRALARLDSFNGANPNLFQGLVVKSTSVAALHVSLYYMSTYL